MLFFTNEFSDELLKSINGAVKSIIVFSAFIKREALEQLFQHASEELDVSLIARWRKYDLLSGASDLSVYEYCKERNWKFGLEQNLHGKLFLIDRGEIFLGSANLTQRGMNISIIGNAEFGTRIKPHNTDLSKLEKYVSDNVIWLDDDLFSLIQKDVENSKGQNIPLPMRAWNEDLDNLLTSKIEFLWVQELLFSKPEALLNVNLDDELQLHDFDLLNLDLESLSETTLKANFLQTRLCSWVKTLLKENAEMNFGAFSHALHNALLDDPTPYRREVKEFIATLFAWLEFLSDEFEVTQHRKTSSVRLKI